LKYTRRGKLVDLNLHYFYTSLLYDFTLPLVP
jgi:hypothetical protein